MRKNRIFVEAVLAESETLELQAETAHYLSRVLRLRNGDRLQVFNGPGHEFLAEVVELTRNQVTLKLLRPVETLANPVLQLHLGLGLSRGERMDYAIQKSTELGVASITPLFTSRSEVKLDPARLKKRLRHWQKIAISACEQCGRSVVPTINTPVDLTEWIEATGGGIIFHPQGASRLRDVDIASTQNLLSGPEGGFTEDEITLARAQGFQVVSLGPRTLRAETTPIVALALLQYLSGDF